MALKALQPQEVESNPLRPEMILRRNVPVVNTLFRPASVVFSAHPGLTNSEEDAVERTLQLHPFGPRLRLPRPVPAIPNNSQLPTFR